MTGPYMQTWGRGLRAGKLKSGQEFTDVSADEFGFINRAANDVGLKALVTLIRTTDDGKEISFRLVSRFDS